MSKSAITIVTASPVSTPLSSAVVSAHSLGPVSTVSIISSVALSGVPVPSASTTAHTGAAAPLRVPAAAAALPFVMGGLFLGAWAL